MPRKSDQERSTSAASPSDAKRRAGGEERESQLEVRHGCGTKPKRPQTTLRKRGRVRIDVRGATLHCINQIQIYENHRGRLQILQAITLLCMLESLKLGVPSVLPFF